MSAPHAPSPGKRPTTTVGACDAGVVRKATQAALDREDGVQILRLGQIIRGFEGAHGRDATIPRLVSISTRRMFNRNRKRTTEAAPATPAEPAVP